MRTFIVGIARTVLCCIYFLSVNVLAEEEKKDAPFILGKRFFGINGWVYATSVEPGLKEHAIVYFDKAGRHPIAHENVTLDGTDKKKSPFYDKKIQHITKFGSNSAVVTESEPATVYYIQSLQMEGEREVDGKREKVVVPMKILSAPSLCDASKKVTAGIVGWSQGSVTKKDEKGNQKLNSGLLVAVKPHEGEFGQHGSGLALVESDYLIVEKEDEEKEEKQESKKDTKKEAEKPDEQEQQKKKEIIHFLNPLDAQTGQDKGNRAVSFDLTTSALSVENGLKSIMPNVVDVYYDSALYRWYVAVHVSTKEGATTDQGARAVVMVRQDEGKVIVEEIAPPAVFRGNDRILGATGSSRQVSIHKVRTMHTDTGLAHLVVVGGNGAPEQTDKLVYALPLINKLGNTRESNLTAIKNPKHGTLAVKESEVQTVFVKFAQGRMMHASYLNAANTHEDVYSNTDQAASVGGGPAPDTIVDVATENNVVLIITQRGDERYIYSSQALFDPRGRIMAWTPWKPMLNKYPHMQELFINSYFSSFAFLMKNEDNSYGMKNTYWISEPLPVDHDLDDYEVKERVVPPMVSMLTAEFPVDKGGIINMQDFYHGTPGLSAPQRTSLLIATGYKKLVLMQTGADNEDGFFVPTNFTQSAQRNSTDGTVHSLEPSSMFSFSGGVLDKLGPISCAEIVTSGDQSWLCVGGGYGMAVLRSPNGAGWSATSGLQKDFAGLRSDMAFSLIDSHKLVTKIMQSGEYVYVLTPKECYRFAAKELASSSVLAKPTVIADVTSFGVRFTDMLISENICLFGSTGGLYSIKLSDESPSLEPFLLPGSAGYSIHTLTGVSSTGLAADCARNGQVYVVAGSLIKNKASVYRLALQNGNVAVVNDTFARHYEPHFIECKGFSKKFATDGVCNIVASAGTKSQVDMFYDFGTGVLPGATSYKLSAILNERFEVRSIIKNSATGDWLIAGDFGVCVHE